MRPLETAILAYFSSQDRSLEKLSHGNEGPIANLPSWCLTARRITLGLTPDQRGAAIRVVPHEVASGGDSLQRRVLRSTADVSKMIGSWTFEGSVERLASIPFSLFGDARVEVVGQPSRPAMGERELVGSGSAAELLKSFTLEKAKHDAISLWNSALSGVQSFSWVTTAREVLVALKNVRQRKAFNERNARRFINAHQRLVLPPFKSCYYEHELFLGKERRVADFILEREAGFPALLIELESPKHKVFKKDGHMTAPANHAKDQIADWVRCIDNAPERNAQGEMAFLVGQKQGLVIIGKGLDKREELLNTRYSGTVVWTYDLLREEARDRWNSILQEEYRLLGLPEERPL